MATSNFKVINAKSYYAFLNTYKVENEEGVMEEVERDEWDWENLLEWIRYRGEEGIFDCHSENRWNRKMDARNVCETEKHYLVFGNGNAWTTDTNIECFIVMRSGYYEGGVFDYEVKLTLSSGDEFYLSDYDSVDDMLDDYLDAVKENVSWYGYDHKWNVGTFKIQKKNIRKWIEGEVSKHIDMCEYFCKENCDVELCVSARFSNGETWYSKVG